MSATTSAATGRCFGIQRVCQVWERSRSARSTRGGRGHTTRLGAGPARRIAARRGNRDVAAAGGLDSDSHLATVARSTAKGIARSAHGTAAQMLRILDGDNRVDPHAF